MQSMCKSFWINLATSRCILTFHRVFTVLVFRSVVVLVVRCSLFRNPNNICKINDRLLRGSSPSRQCMKWNWCAAWETISFVMFKGAFRESVLLSIFKVLNTIGTLDDQFRMLLIHLVENLKYWQWYWLFKRSLGC